MKHKEYPEQEGEQNPLIYRGYYARIVYDAEDNIFVGSVLGIADSVSFHGRNKIELIDSFHKSIENYLEMVQK